MTELLEQTDISVRTAADVVETLQYLRERRLAGDEGGFVEALKQLGMPDGEAESYWPSLEAVGAGDWRQARDNTTIAHHFGIQLRANIHGAATGTNDGPVPMNGVTRNWLLYRIVSLALPDLLECSISGTQHMGGEKGKAVRGSDPGAKRACPADKIMISFGKFPTGLATARALSIWRFLQGEAATQFSQTVVKAAHGLQEALESEDLGFQLASLLVDQKMLIPPPGMAQLVGRVLKAGLAGEEIVIGGAFCPDYAYVRTGNPDHPYKYTFDGVGEGIGLVAQQFARIVPAVSEFLRGLEIRHRFVLGIGDFEAHDQGILESVGVGEAEFYRRCEASLAAFGAEIPADVPLALEMCWRDRAGDRLRRYSEPATARMLDGDFGSMPEVFADWEAIVARIPPQYRSFYENWFKREMTDRELMEVILRQAGEYAALAQIAREDFGENLLMLAGDRPEMNKFNCFPAPIATLCAKRAY